MLCLERAKVAGRERGREGGRERERERKDRQVVCL
jgi:hypothetical protein